MNKLICKLTNLIEVKKIIALSTILVFCGLAVAGKIDTTVFTSVVTLIVGYYFGQSTANNSNSKGDIK
ncbi:hypothetical protein [Clostridium butyricum]|uniref:Phage exported protein n=1 Tax=Clostridium butyricum E4 str. BoNT E BL5262 TaxID=632245 RepID=C4IJK4_CLOBU|nr:hypothetical protein [Clostridium butyricum]EDT74831.1 conserved hypothetical protein [Clostridium butyricum 5521]EEP53859.1 conserved hypothetical protein [Clostridium butyricum E4 str. BoNT E BL5262]NFL33396.1 hypothetical protein [Clostridium butyricum]NFS20485.1 hypothetical protein [Clostridium butyricum]